MLVQIKPHSMANLAFRPRLGRRAWLLLVLSVSSLVSYACGGEDEMDDADGIGGMGGGGIVVKPPTGGTSSDGSGGSTANNKPAFASCSLPGQGTPPTGSMILDDFDDGDAVVLGDGRHGNWYEYDDETEGGSHTPTWDDEPDGWLPEAGGIEEGGYALHTSGGGFTLWGSGQGLAPVWDDDKKQECLFDASGFDGVTFWIKGEIDGSESSAIEEDRGVLKVGFTEPDILPLEVGGRCDPDEGSCYDWHKARISLSACWQKVSIPFDQMEQDGWGLDGGELNTDEIVNLNLEIAQGNTFDYWLDQVEFFSGEPPEADEICDEGLGGAGGMGGGGP